MLRNEGRAWRDFTQSFMAPSFIGYTLPVLRIGHTGNTNMHRIQLERLRWTQSTVQQQSGSIQSRFFTFLLLFFAFITNDRWDYLRCVKKYDTFNAINTLNEHLILSNIKVNMNGMKVNILLIATDSIKSNPEPKPNPTLTLTLKTDT